MRNANWRKPFQEKPGKTIMGHIDPSTAQQLNSSNQQIKMNLVIDMGNTAAKLAVFSDGKMLMCRREKEITPDIVKEILDTREGLDRCILSSVSSGHTGIRELLTASFPYFLEPDHTTPIPLINQYESPSTLGYDRIADAVGANTIFPGRNVLIIDAGTAITIDLVTEEGKFTGGNISPGAAVRARALNTYTSRLPLVDLDGEYRLMGRKTEEAIRSGILSGILFELEGYIIRMIREFKDLQIILTGGDAKYFDKKLNYSIFVDSNLNLTGLNRILDYNAT